MIYLSEEQRENLLILADGIAGVDPDFFKMVSYRGFGYVVKKDLDNCGTVGCALGWGPFIPELKPSKVDFYDFDGSLSWCTYARKFITQGDNPHGYKAWNWCFHEKWTRIDDTPTGAALRIYELLVNGVPENAGDQMKGYDTYMFAEAL